MELKNEKSKYLLNSRGFKLYSVEWYPYSAEIKAIVYVCYGYAEHMHSGYYETLAAPLNEIGCMVCGHDYQGHGRSQGGRGNFASLNQIVEDVIMHINLLKLRYPNFPILIFGCSFGGIVAVQAATEYPNLFDGIILESPAVDFNWNFKTIFLISLGRCLGLFCPCVIIKRFSDSITQSDEYRIQTLTAGTSRFLIISILKIKHQLIKVNIPIFVALSEFDNLIPYQTTVQLINLSPSKEKSIKIYKNSQHNLRFDNDKDRIGYLNDLKEWLLERI